MATQRIIIQSNGVGTAGFVMSLIGLLTCGCLSPVGLFFSLIGLLQAPRGMAFVGTVLGIVGSWWLWASGAAILLGMMSGAVTKARDEARAASQSQQVTVEPTAEPEPVAVLPEKPPEPEYRTFRDNSGKFEVQAKFDGVKDGKVILIRDTGKTIEVPLERMSDEDKAWIAEQK